MTWQPIETVPYDDVPVFVFLEAPLKNSYIQIATFHPKVTVIGNMFDFDVPKPLAWKPITDTLDNVLADLVTFKE